MNNAITREYIIESPNTVDISWTDINSAAMTTKVTERQLPFIGIVNF